MYASATDYTPGDFYHLMTQAIIPRPIAWVLTHDHTATAGAGGYNLAPFSFFNGVSANPAMVMVSMVPKHTGGAKDTLTNLRQNGKATIHIPPQGMADAMVDSSVELPYGQSELRRAENYTLEAGPLGFLPRIAGPKVAFFTSLEKEVTFENSASVVVFCRIEHIYIADDALGHDSKGRMVINPQVVDPVARLGGNWYAGLGALAQRHRPKS